MKYEFSVNDRITSLSSHPLRRLLDILRHDLGLTGTKEGCGEGECGACSVLMDGKLVNSCMIPALQLPGTRILTIEGLGSGEDPDLLQRAFVEEGAVQCGFCTPGMIMASRYLLMRNPHPSREEIREGLSGNLCRCTGYEKIFRAVEKAARKGYGDQTPISAGMSPSSEVIFEEKEKELYFIPRDLHEALQILHKKGKTLTCIAGTTDFMPALRNRKIDPLSVMDISKIPELKGIRSDERSVHIGSCVDNATLSGNSLIRKYLPAIAEAASLSGAMTLQNRATIGGNIMTASPAADLPPVLMALKAELVFDSFSGKRKIGVNDLSGEYHKTGIREDELLESIILPIPPEGTIQAFYKRGSRAALTISRVALACSGSLGNNGILKDIRIAAGSMAPSTQMLSKVMDYLEGKTLDHQVIDQAMQIASGEVNPRKTPAYRKEVTANLVRRFLLKLQEEQKRRS